MTGGVFTEQVIRPTGLLDPEVEIRPVSRCRWMTCWTRCVRSPPSGYRTLVTTLTKRMAEDLTEYLHEQGIKVRYMHSDIDTLERIEILRDLRLGAFDVLVGINLLREGLDIPECGLVAILDADKEGLLAFGNLADTDHRSRCAERRWARDHVCRQASPVRWNAPWAKPTAAAPNSWPITRNTASRRRQ